MRQISTKNHFFDFELELEKLKIMNSYLNSNKKLLSLQSWLERRDYYRRSLGLKPTRAILLCPWEKDFTALCLRGDLGKKV